MLWSKLIQQAQNSLNLLLTSRVHPKISAYHALEGTHDFNRHPFAPPATRATIFNPPESRISWGTRATDAWYIGPTWDHYRCLTFHIPSTGRERISGQYTLYPQQCNVPTESPMDEAKRIAAELVEAVKKLQDQETRQPGRHTRALQTLSAIFRGETAKTHPISHRASPNVHRSNERRQPTLHATRPPTPNAKQHPQHPPISDRNSSAEFRGCAQFRGCH